MVHALQLLYAGSYGKDRRPCGSFTKAGKMFPFFLLQSWRLQGCKCNIAKYMREFKIAVSNVSVNVWITWFVNNIVKENVSSKTLRSFTKLSTTILKFMRCMLYEGVGRINWPHMDARSSRSGNAAFILTKVAYVKHWKCEPHQVTHYGQDTFAPPCTRDNGDLSVWHYVVCVHVCFSHKIINRPHSSNLRKKEVSLMTKFDQRCQFLRPFAFVTVHVWQIAVTLFDVPAWFIPSDRQNSNISLERCFLFNIINNLKLGLGKASWNEGSSRTGIMSVP